jgi:hypothetical protein
MLGHVLPPTSDFLGDPAAKPYFLWWANVTVEQFRKHLREGDIEQRAYWLGALLREANTRDVWLFVSPDEIRRDWTHLGRHLGRARALWAFLLDIEGERDHAGRQDRETG